jgi:hypothetical protein
VAESAFKFSHYRRVQAIDKSPTELDTQALYLLSDVPVSEAVFVRRIEVVVPVALFMLIGIPAYAYADPTGGALFQILMPTLAALWGMWLIFANKIRRGLGTVLRKLRGKTPDPQSTK